ncbi:hypothetical protein BDZ89DRAFT_1142724 [Hymenopellis radicata]|nr:hypothetical protein BDZ89DRAFT_1151610 [Hymenopellis radicata]KAF8993212.1 hypothetical protein BDZ89DRAFT_1150705 [Hymenopellis radicata]KAF8999743.1 hypothetical protein BDZ89DRAFT_1147544 [Hymenopellis radicata]KAF9012934.1 hypothetical protein BDZ89DRAFT_1142724 [Hymenopellis radicata]
MPTKTRKQKTGKPKTRKPKQNVWQVEALIGVRYDVDGLAVRVDWADYGKKSRTWEPLKHFAFPEGQVVNNAMFDRLWAHLTERHKISREVFENGGYNVPTLWVSRRFFREECRFYRMVFRNDIVEKLVPLADDNEDVEDPDQENDQTYAERYAAWRAMNSDSPLSDG